MFQKCSLVRVRFTWIMMRLRSAMLLERIDTSRTKILRRNNTDIYKCINQRTQPIPAILYSNWHPAPGVSAFPIWIARRRQLHQSTWTVWKTQQLLIKVNEHSEGVGRRYRRRRGIKRCFRCNRDRKPNYFRVRAWWRSLIGFNLRGRKF